MVCSLWFMDELLNRQNVSRLYVKRLMQSTKIALLIKFLRSSLRLCEKKVLILKTKLA